MSEENEKKSKEYQKNSREAKKHASDVSVKVCYKYIFFSFFYYF